MERVINYNDCHLCSYNKEYNIIIYCKSGESQQTELNMSNDTYFSHLNEKEHDEQGKLASSVSVAQ